MEDLSRNHKLILNFLGFFLCYYCFFKSSFDIPSDAVAAADRNNGDNDFRFSEV